MTSRRSKSATHAGVYMRQKMRESKKRKKEQAEKAMYKITAADDEAVASGSDPENGW